MTKNFILDKLRQTSQYFFHIIHDKKHCTRLIKTNFYSINNYSNTIKEYVFNPKPKELMIIFSCHCRFIVS